MQRRQEQPGGSGSESQESGKRVYRERGREHAPIPAEVERVGAEIVDSAVVVHRELGPGLLESVYESCLAHELELRNIPCERQVVLPLRYCELRIEHGFRIDLQVSGLVIVEVKAVEQTAGVHEAQLPTYLRLSGLRLGFLLNFNVGLMKSGIRRRVV